MSELFDIDRVDFGDPYDIGAFVSALCQYGCDLGMLCPGFKPTRETNQVRQLANRVVRRLNDRMPEMAVADAFAVVPAYDFVHRIAYMVPAEAKYLNGFVLKAFDAMLHGDKSVDEYEMFRRIRQAIARRDPAYFDKPLQWSCITEDYWYKEAAGDKTGIGLSDYDIVSRAAVLIEIDLYAYEGRAQDQFKQTLFSRHRHYLDNHDATDLRLLTALDRLLTASCSWLTPEEFESYSSRIAREKLALAHIVRFHNSGQLPCALSLL